MRPTLAKWLERDQPIAQTDGVKAWMGLPLPAITHRVKSINGSTAFVQFKDDSPCPDNSKDVLLLSSKLRPQFEAQLVFNDLSKVSREWSLCFHKESIDALKLCGVTGTNGKSSVAHFLAHLISANKNLGSAAKLGTLGLETSKGYVGSPNTTPFPLDLHPMLERVHQDRDSILVMEASSHALDQNRLDGLIFEVAGLTNLTQDHLDYHETMEHLFASKSKLLELCKGQVWVNLDCEWMSRHKDHQNAMTYSTKSPGADLYAEILSKRDRGFEIKIHFGSESQIVYLPLLGEFNVENSLCALGMALSLDDSALSSYCAALEKMTAPKGRLQLVDCPAKGRVIIDYAHTPDALESVMKTMRAHVDNGKLKVLFGCGGNRDTAKRAMMGEVAARYADYIYLTSDNPRYEEPEAIIDDIEKGLSKEIQYEKITSREEAIVKSLRELNEDEVILLCGKGHETTQEINGEKFPMCEEDLCQKI